MPADYLLSVDLGTSHTVAVVIWPDGRTRPLLFDGSPVMPSAVFLDEAGTIHVGRDAERLAATAPERFEPNPKQRVADGTLLLGDRELPVTAAFAAILTRVARQCVEVVGGLPQTVLTCPAAWGEQRRDTLHDAAAQAGYAPVRIITEPVAAAHYYAGRLAHPINPGGALAVFDFGGGTLDIAVVERRPDGTFGVLADGGLSDLGGLDFDAALVGHIGETVKAKDPELWQRLEQPATASAQRDRRTLWNDVRGAKEMLSRSSVAPVPVPGLEQALHLTRGELDQLARPLLSRAVGETQRVIDLTGRRSADLAGLFLVGGSSRMPQVAKILHEQLGIAPTALEQPELPVSEGAVLALAAPAPVTPPAAYTPPASPPQPHAHGSLPPSPPDTTLPLQHVGDAKGRNRKRNKLIAIAAGIAVLAIAVPLLWLYVTNPLKQREFTDFTETGDLIAYEAEPNGSLVEVRRWGDRGAVFYTADTDMDEEMRVMAVDLESGEPMWDGEAVLDGADWGNSYWISEELMVFRQETVTSGMESVSTWYFLDWEDGGTLGTVETPDWQAAVWDDQFITGWEGGDTITVYDREGTSVHEWKVGDADAEEPVTIEDWDVVGSPDDLVKPSEPVRGDGLMWALTSDGAIKVFDIDGGEQTASEVVESVDDQYFGYNGKLYVNKAESNGYWINVYDLDDGLAEFDQERVRDEDATADHMSACGEQRVCVREPVADASDRYTYRVYDADDGEFVHEFDEFEYDEDVEAVGDRLLVGYFEGESDVRTQVYDKDFDTVGESKVETFDGIDGGSALAWPAASSFGTGEGDVVALGVRDGSRHLLRADLTSYACRANEERLLCGLEEGIQVYSFRE